MNKMLRNLRTWLNHQLHDRRLLREASCRGRSAEGAAGVLIMGWYGKETTGDKAILASLLSAIGPGIQVVKASYDPAYSQQTLREIDAEHVRCIANDNASILRAMADVDVVLIGGGPLMESSQMSVWRNQLSWAKQLGKRLMIYGCGVGPLQSSRRRREVAELLRLADAVTLRDARSIANAVDLGIDLERLVLSADPAVTFAPNHAPRGQRAATISVGVSLRHVSRQYLAGMAGRTSGERLQAQFMDAAVAAVDGLLAVPGRRALLVPMQMHPKDDDRQVLSRLQQRLDWHDRADVLAGYRSPGELLARFGELDFFVGMRFHSVVFSLLAGVPLVAIDYDAGGGKVSSLLRDVQLHDYVLNITEATPERFSQLVQRGFDHRQKIAEQIARHFPAIQQRERRNADALRQLLPSAPERANIAA